METIQIIVECSMDETRERSIAELGEIKYSLPMINSYVIEIPKNQIYKIQGMEGVKSVYQNAYITAQIGTAKESMHVEENSIENLTGLGVTIAVLDTGISPVDDFVKPKNRIKAFRDFVNNKKDAYDDNAHGTHVAAIAVGNGFCSNGKHAGMAPEAEICAIKILDDNGSGNSSDVLAGIQWVIDNHKKYNIRIVNLSIGTVDIGSKDPLVRAVEVAWDMGIVVTIAAGNNGPLSGTITSPGISRKVITIGSSDDHRETSVSGNDLINFSGRGPTSECIIKPDILAPGSDIVSCFTTTPLSEKRKSELKFVDDKHIKMSGTSMSTPMVTGAIALLLQKYPMLTPNQVKYKLKQSCIDLNRPQNQQGWGLLDVAKLVK